MNRNINEARDISGCGLDDIRRGMNDMPTSDPLLAAFYMYARSCALVVKEDREQWNRDYATERLLQWERNHP